MCQCHFSSLKAQKISKNHGIDRVGRDLWRSSSPTFCQGRVKVEKVPCLSLALPTFLWGAALSWPVIWWAESGRTRRNYFKLKEERFGLGVRSSLLRGWWGTSCPDKLWMPHPWQCLRPGWMGLEATWSSWVAFLTHGVEIGTRRPLRFISTQAILWYYDH